MARIADCTNPIFRGAPKADYNVDLQKPVDALYGYTVSEDFQRSEQQAVLSAAHSE